MMLSGAIINLQDEYRKALDLHDSGLIDDAEKLYRSILRHEPRHFAAAYSLGAVFLSRNDYAAAEQQLALATSIEPGNPFAQINRGVALKGLGRLDESLRCTDRAIAIHPQFAMAHYNRGNILRELRRFDEAIASYDRAIAIAPDYAEAFNNRGNAVAQLSRFEEALASCDRAIALNPDHAEAFNNRGHMLRDLARIEDAVTSYRRALEIQPDFAVAHSNLLFALNYQDGAAAEQVFAEHLAWEPRHRRATQAHTVAIAADDPERVLRVGYVSGDLNTHSVAYFFEPVLEARDRNAFHVTCYASSFGDDATTERLRTLSDAWRNIAPLSDDEADALIRSDRIDILVDLSGHTGRNRLSLFARRVAPIQVTYLGYPNTTGLSTMDYRFTDAWADPVGRTDALHTETLVRLDGGFLCYRPPEDAPPVTEPPVLASGRITFGSFNALAKINAALIARWAAILAGVPGSRLMLKTGPLADAEARSSIRSLFARSGIAPERIDLSGWTGNIPTHLARYGDIDIALDTFPYNGTTTTCEALWMGVPVVSQAGQVHASRVGASLLSQIGLDALIASSPEAYVQTAIDLAHDIPRLRDMRSALRARMASSPLMDSARIARAVDSAYRTMWRQHCVALAPAD